MLKSMAAPSANDRGMRLMRTCVQHRTPSMTRTRGGWGLAVPLAPDISPEPDGPALRSASSCSSASGARRNSPFQANANTGVRNAPSLLLADDAEAGDVDAMLILSESGRVRGQEAINRLAMIAVMMSCSTDSNGMLAGCGGVSGLDRRGAAVFVSEASW